MTEGKRGRPRNEQARKAILDAAYGLLLETGFAAVTSDKIAERAGVSKATLYKWWPNKAAVVIDGYLSAAKDRLPVPDTGDVFEDVAIHAASLARFLTGPQGKGITEFVGAGQLDESVKEIYKERYFGPRREEAAALLERGIARGQLPGGLAVRMAVDLLYGPLFYRLLITGDPLEEEDVRSLVALAFAGLGLRKEQDV